MVRMRSEVDSTPGMRRASEPVARITLEAARTTREVRRAVDPHSAVALQGAEAGDGVDAVLLEELSDAPGVLVDNLVLAPAHAGQIRGRRPGQRRRTNCRAARSRKPRQSAAGPWWGYSRQCRQVPPSLGSFLHDADLEAILRRPDGGHVAAGAATDDQYVVAHG